MIKKIFIVFIVIAFSLPLPIHAALGTLGFGGYVVSALECTCPPTLGFYITYGLLYPIQYPYVTHSLFLPIGAIAYKYQQFIYPPAPTSWELGMFIPGIGGCLTGAPPECVPLYADGTIVYLGASYPGHTLVGF